MTADSSPRSRRWIVGVAVALAAITLAGHVYVTLRLYHAFALTEANVLFDADPGVYLTSFTTGANSASWGGRSFAHPHISNVIYPLVTAAARALAFLGPSSSTFDWSYRVALLIAPIAAAAEVVLLFVAFLSLDLAIIDAVLLVALSQVAFSGLMFGSIPESYSLAGASFALLFYIAARTARRHGSFSWPEWLAASVAVTGVTITNLAACALTVLAVVRDSGGVGLALRRAILLTAATLAITVAGYQLEAAVSHDVPSFLPGNTGQTEELKPPRVSRLLAEFPNAVANTFIPPAPLQMSYTEARQRHQFIFTFRPAAGRVPGQAVHTVFLVGALILAAFGARWARPWQQSVLAAAGLVLAFNAALHVTYGTELFLYSQHWEIAVLVLFSAALMYPPPFARVGRAGLAVLVLACAWNDIVVWHGMMRILAAATG